MTQAKKTTKAEVNSNLKEKTSLYLSPDILKSIKYMAFMSRETQTSVVDKAISNYIKQWEKENGPIPKKFLT